jgi:hypothetical protein
VRYRSAWPLEIVGRIPGIIPAALMFRSQASASASAYGSNPYRHRRASPRSQGQTEVKIFGAATSIGAVVSRLERNATRRPRFIDDDAINPRCLSIRAADAEPSLRTAVAVVSVSGGATPINLYTNMMLVAHGPPLRRRRRKLPMT